MGYMNIRCLKSYLEGRALHRKTGEKKTLAWLLAENV